MMKYLWTTLHVNNLKESVQFYSDVVGLKVLQQFPAGPEITIIFMGNGTSDETIIELFENKNEMVTPINDYISAGFEVVSAEVMLQTVQNKNIPIYHGIMETPKFKWFDIKDPNGLTIQFFERK